MLNYKWTFYESHGRLAYNNESVGVMIFSIQFSCYDIESWGHFIHCIFVFIELYSYIPENL